MATAHQVWTVDAAWTTAYLPSRSRLRSTLKRPLRARLRAQGASLGACT